MVPRLRRFGQLGGRCGLVGALERGGDGGMGARGGDGGLAATRGAGLVDAGSP